MQQSELLAERLNALSTPEDLVRSAFMRFYAREPDAFELASSVSMLKREGVIAFTRALFNTSEFLFVF
jgi:hypothetical protein